MKPDMIPLEEPGLRRVVRAGTPLYWCDERDCFVVERRLVLYEECNLAGLVTTSAAPSPARLPWHAYLPCIGLALVGGAVLLGFVWLSFLLAMGAEGLSW